MRKQLDQQSLDRCSMTTGAKEKEYPGLKVRDYYSGKLTLTCEYYASHEMPHIINENDWIPMMTAAAIVGVSKQAISDRIRRKTIEAKKAKSQRYMKEPNITLVQLGACRKRKKAGRPRIGILNTPKCCGAVKEFYGNQKKPNPLTPHQDKPTHKENESQP